MRWPSLCSFKRGSNRTEIKQAAASAVFSSLLNPKEDWASFEEASLTPIFQTQNSSLTPRVTSQWPKIPYSSFSLSRVSLFFFLLLLLFCFWASGNGQGEDPACSNSTNYLNAHGQLIAKPIFTRENRYAIFATEKNCRFFLMIFLWSCGSIANGAKGPS